MTANRPTERFPLARLRPAYPVAAGMALLACLTLTACGKKAEAPANHPPQVGVVTIAPVSMAVSSELRGRTTAYQIAEVRPQVNGIIQKRLFIEGADVKAGVALYQIDAALYQAAYDSAKGNLAKAQATAMQAKSKADRYKELVAIKAVSQQDYDDASATIKQADADVLVAKAAVDNARINLAYTRVSAPISGRIGASAVTAGALVSANQANSMTTIQQLDPIYVDVPQSSIELLKLRQALANGQIQRNGEGRIKVSLKLEDGSPYAEEGTLQFSDITVDPGTSSINLRTLFPNPKHELLPGMFVSAVLQEGTNDKAILAPQQGVTRNNSGQPVALVVVDGKVVQRVLTVNGTYGDKWLVTSGLNAGDKLIVDGLQKAKPGQPVEAVAATLPSARTDAADAAANSTGQPAAPTATAPAAGAPNAAPASAAKQ